MGGHGGAHGNQNNMQESDEQMLHKIQRIETIKHCPNHWHMEFFDGSNMYNILGGMPTLVYAGAGAAISVMYFNNVARHMQYNYYAYNMRLWGRIAVGGVFGLAAGYMQFGDRQRLHNAWVAERLRRRYPECLSLNVKDLWQYKGVKATQEYYKWT